MKKLLYTIPMILLLLCSCSQAPKEWQNIAVKNLGEFKIPNTWTASQADDKIIIADKNNDIYAVGTFFDDDDRASTVFSIESVGEISLDDGESWGSVSSFSNSSMIEKNYCYVNGEQKSLDCIFLSNADEKGKPIDYMLIFLKSVDDDTIKTIAQSYSRYE